MSKNNKKGAPKPVAKAPEVAPTVEPEVVEKNNTPQKPIQVLDLNEFMEKVGKVSQEGLDPNRRVDLLKMMHETWRIDPEAAKKYGVSQETVDNINRITAVGQVAALACEAAFGKNPFAITMNSSQLLALAEVGKDMGININTKALPAPDKNGNVTVTTENINVSAEAKKQLAEEEKIKVAKPSIDPTKIENEDDLKKAILSIMIDRNDVFSKIIDSINFYRSYLGVQANKSDKKDEELKKLNSKTNVELLKEIRGILVECPFVLNGMGKAMQNYTAVNKSPIPAFCMFRNATKNKQTGVPALDDQEIAGYVRVLVEWANDLRIKVYENEIANHKKNIKELSTDKKANAKAIESCNSKIEAAKKNIEHLKETIEFVSMPTSDTADNLLTNYNEKDRSAMSIFKHIVDSFYSDIDVSTLDPGTLKNNIQQYAGIITNMFRDPTTPLMAYNEANLIEVTAVVESEGETEETEEESKKA